LGENSPNLVTLPRGETEERAATEIGRTSGERLQHTISRMLSIT
jgi:hypothetical protein